MLSKPYGCRPSTIFLVDQSSSYMFEYYEVRLLPALYNIITVDMLFNIVGHTIDGNYESWKYIGHKTARDRLTQTLGQDGFMGGVEIMHIFFFHIS